jgi:hypothetical protein
MVDFAGHDVVELKERRVVREGWGGRRRGILRMDLEGGVDARLMS